MKRQYSLILGLVAILTILVLVGQSVDFFATTTGSDGQVWSCKGRYYSSPAYSVSYFQDVANSCMRVQNDVVCEAGEVVESSSGFNYFRCVQICAMCDTSQAYLFTVDYDCGAHGLIEIDQEDMKSYLLGGRNGFTEQEAYDKYCAPPPPPPPPNMVNCYTCVNGELVTEQYENSCPSGLSTSRPTCEVTPPQTTTCYKCDVVTNQLLSTQIAGTSCPEEYTKTRPNCDVKNTLCYQCLDGVVTTDSFSQSCPSGWEEYEQGTTPTCSSSFIEWLRDLIDFEEKPVESSFLIGALLLLLVSIFFTVKDLRDDSSSRGGF